MINLTINGKAVQAPEGSTILEAARLADIYIPTLCYDKAVEVYGHRKRPCSSVKKGCNGTAHVSS